MAKRSRTAIRTKKQSKRRALHALEIASREVHSGSDSDGEDYGRHNAIVNAQKGSGDDSDAESFQDEELDSDEVFGSDDDYDVMSSKFSQTIRDKKKAKKVVKKYYDSEEDDGGYTSIEEEDLLPLSAVWDKDDREESGEEGSQNDASTLQLRDDVSEEGSEGSSEDSSSEEEEPEEDEDPFDGLSDDNADVELSTITSMLHKNSEEKQLKRLQNYAGGEENEFAIPSDKNSTKLRLQDMLEVMEDPKLLENTSLLKGTQDTLAVPLPQRIQKRHERRAAYELSKDEVSKWQDTVQDLRKAEHISFPLNPEIKHNDSNVFIRDSGRELSEVEQKVSKVLEESNLKNPIRESTFEEIATAKMSPEEMKKRTAELRLMRELMFREERKAKRIKKIKSKAYRRIKKKELLKNKELIDSDESDEDHDIARAKERMTLKHKTHGKWARDMIKHGMTKDSETREEMEEMLKQGEKLRSKIMGRGDEEESDVGIDDLEKDGATSGSDEESVREKVGKTGVLNMAFMRNAEAREKEANREEIARLKSLENGEEELLFDDESLSSANKIVNQGRRTYTPGTDRINEEQRELNKSVSEAIKEDESKSLVNRLSKSKKKTEEKKKSKEETVENTNPWVNDSDDDEFVKKSSKVHILDKDSSKASKSAHKIEKDLAKRAKRKASTHKDEELLLDLEDSNKLKIVDAYGGSDDENSKIGMFQQQDVIADAFAGDDVVKKFEEEKKRVAIDEDDKEEDVTLPGWGEWAGAGAEKKKKRKFTKKIKGVVEKDKRRDKNMKNVIINEKVNKKNLKYQSSAVPFPFESREQYERSLRMPLGQEWTSRTSHQKMIKPRILTKSSMVIDPLKAPFK